MKDNFHLVYLVTTFLEIRDRAKMPPPPGLQAKQELLRASWGWSIAKWEDVFLLGRFPGFPLYVWNLSRKSGTGIL